MKHEWRKHEKEIYQPKSDPMWIQIPKMNFFVVEGSGDPNGNEFPHYIKALYALSYTIRMSPKKDRAPSEYFEYSVYPLEGVWDYSKDAKAILQQPQNQGKPASALVSKSDLVFRLMIRQPDFVTGDYAQSVREWAMEEKKLPLLEKCRFETIEEGPCVQMLHLGPYDDEPASFQRMEDFASLHNLERLAKQHREIYLTDASKTAPEKLKTILRFRVGIS